MSGEQVRCFVAVDISPAVREAVARLQEEVRAAAPRADVRWVDPAGIHVTLKFLGGVPADRVPSICEALAAPAAATPAIALAAGGLGAFPSVRRARVVWVGVTEGGAALGRLAAAVDAALAPLGFPPEGRPFRAHLTVGRVRSPRGLAPLGVLVEAGGGRAGSWTAEEMVLYRSRLRPTGATYEPLARLPLGGGP